MLAKTTEGSINTNYMYSSQIKIFRVYQCYQFVSSSS